MGDYEVIDGGLFGPFSICIQSGIACGAERWLLLRCAKANGDDNAHDYDSGQNLSYQATIGFIEVMSWDHSAKACVFYTSYTVAPQKGEVRPITFAFNGGPGSASAWLHLGLLGPMRVDMGPDGLTPPSNPALIPNDYSLLDLTDVVMIDPVATGFSHTENGAAGIPSSG